MISVSIKKFTLIFHVHSKLLRSVGGAVVEKRQPKAYEVDVAGTSLGVFCQKRTGKIMVSWEKHKGPRRLSMKWLFNEGILISWFIIIPI